MRRCRLLVVMLAAGLAGLAGCGGSDSPEASLEVVVSPARFACDDDDTSITGQTCTPLEAVALVSCSPDRISFELPAGMAERDVDAGDVCGELADRDELLAPEPGASCAQPRGRVTVDGELDGEPVRLALRKCTETRTAADAWARLVGLPFVGPPHR